MPNETNVIRDAAATLRASAGELEATRRRGLATGADAEDLDALRAEADRRRRLADELERRLAPNARNG